MDIGINEAPPLKCHQSIQFDSYKELETFGKAELSGETASGEILQIIADVLVKKIWHKLTVVGDHLKVVHDGLQLLDLPH